MNILLAITALVLLILYIHKDRKLGREKERAYSCGRALAKAIRYMDESDT